MPCKVPFCRKETRETQEVCDDCRKKFIKWEHVRARFRRHKIIPD